MAVEATPEQVAKGEEIQTLEDAGEWAEANVARGVVGAQEIFTLGGDIEPGEPQPQE